MNNINKRIIKTLNKMFDKFDDYEYSENGFEDTKEYNELRNILIDLIELEKVK